VKPAFAFLLLAAAPALAQEAKFEPQGDRFADAGACRIYLEQRVAEARGDDYVAVRGPYAIGPGDVRIHMVRSDGDGHVITEYRCLDSELSVRSWRHSMTGDADEPATVESMARDAEWLKKDGPKQQ
jgi:hypothetical protein